MLNTGHNGVAAVTGGFSRAETTASVSVAVATYSSSTAVARGYNSIAATTGLAAAGLVGEEGIAVAIWPDTKLAGGIGSLLVWRLPNPALRESAEAKFVSLLVDGKNVKPNTWYSWQ